MSKTDHLIKVEDLCVVTDSDETCIVEEVGFSLHAGETLGLVGESGSGKTTVALALLGHARHGLRIAGGSVLVDGADVLTMDSKDLLRVRGRQVAYVAQDPASALNPALRVGTQLREVLRKGRPEDAGEQWADHRLTEVLVDVRLENVVVDAYPHQLSGGQQQRVVLAMAFALRPSVIVLDEPTTGLDVSTERHILETVRTLCATYGAAAIFVTHDVSAISDLAEQVAVMYAGRIVELGPAADVFAAPVHPYAVGLFRAVPSVERTHVLVGLPGQPPRPRERPHGCCFAPRCNHCEPGLCTTDQPALARWTDAHWVRCVRARDLVNDAPDDAAARPPQHVAGGHPVLAAERVRASYGETAVLHSVDLEVLEGECLAIVGESGSGKTTLARCLVGLHQRWDGTISWRGQELPRSLRNRTREQLRAIQYIFQSPYGSLNPRKQVSAIIGQPVAQFSNAARREREQRIIHALESAALSTHFRNLRPGQMSGGERQRVAIARALAARPDVLVCDEVTSSLDVSVQATIVEMLRRLQAEQGLTVIFITHNLALVRSIAHRVAVMHNGQLVEVGETSDVLDRPQADYTRQLLADLPGLSAAAPDLKATGSREPIRASGVVESPTHSATDG